MTVRTAKIVLSLVWVGTGLPLLFVLMMRHLSGFYDPDPKAAWTWAAQYLFPNLTLIAGAWSVSPSPADRKAISSGITFWGAVILSLFYLVALYLVMGAQMVSEASFQTIFEQSALFLGLIQALVVGWLGKFFIETRR
jgi:hypothetical protein